MKFHRALPFGFSSACLLLVTHGPVAAQAVPTAEVRPQTVAVSTVSPGSVLLPTFPELPPLEPILPETVEQATQLVLKLGERRVYVYQDGEVKTSYPVAIGKPGWETPTGQFEVMDMLKNPGWTNPFTDEVVESGPDNPLGDRWIAFWTDGTNYIGFHGTPNRESVGRAASHGCVRMYNEDIRELYSMVSVGTTVVVEP